MSWDEPPPPLITLPSDLSELTVAQLLACFQELARCLEYHYAAELQRYNHRRDERQQALWPDDELPF
jgi:hypothetical protein